MMLDESSRVVYAAGFHTAKKFCAVARFCERRDAQEFVDRCNAFLIAHPCKHVRFCIVRVMF